MQIQTLGLVVAAAVLTYGQEPPARLPLQNPGFETLRPDGRPVGWQSYDFRTGGQAALLTGTAHSGTHAVVLKSAAVEQRAAWSQKLAWPPDNRALTVGGWYRTVGVAAAPDRGASLRVLFHRSLEKGDEIGLKQAFFAPSQDWALAQATFLVPPETVAVVIELFHWLTPGETQWDDVWIRPATAAETQANALPRTQQVDRDPVFGQNKPYTPADGETVGLNPPPFLWLPSGDTVTYRLEVGRNSEFTGAEVIRRQDLSWCCEMLTEGLATGTWYWRYGVDTGVVPTVWSKPRRFEVSATAVPWPYPGRAAFRVPAARPRLFVREGRLPELRRRAQDGDLKRMAVDLVAAVRRYAGEELIAEPGFVPKGGQERGQVYSTIIRTTRPPMDRMEQAALAYLLSGDAACGAEAKRRVLHFFGWDPKGSTRVFHNDEPAMWIMMRGIRAYDWTCDLFTPEERGRVEACMRLRATDFYDLLRRRPYDNNPYESHAGRIIGFLGEAALEFLPDWPEARTWLDYIARIYWGVYPAWGGDDGGWNEGPGYWAAYMTFALHFVVALREATGVDLSQRPFFHQTPYYRLYLTPPYSKMSPFGDGAQFTPTPPAELMYWFSSLSQDPHLRWYADELHRDGGNQILGIVLHDDRLLGRPPLDLPQARCFEKVGLVSLHTALGNGADDVSFCLRSSPYGAVSHGHNDQNCFVLEAFGEALAVATGHYNYYGSEHHDKWTRQTKAKCGITYDGGQGQDRGWQARGRIAGFLHGEGFDWVWSDATPAYGGRLTRAGREVVHVRPGVFVLRDDLASAEPRRFEFRLHALERMDADSAARSVLIRQPRASLRADFLVPQTLELTQTDQFDTPVSWPPDRAFANQWHLTAAFAQPVTAGEFLTVLSAAKPDREAERPAARLVESDTARGVELIFADGAKTLVGFARPGQGGSLALADVRGDGRGFAVARASDGAIRAWLLAAGTHLQAGGVLLAQAAAPMDLSACVAADGGRIDSNGPGGEVTVHWPLLPKALTRAGDPVTLRFEASRLRPVLDPGTDSLTVWQRPPAAPGPVALGLHAGETTGELRGVRYGRGATTVAGRLRLPRGAYRLALPAEALLASPTPDEQGRLWLTGDEPWQLGGRDLPARLTLEPVAPAVDLPALPCAEIPPGTSFEAERNWGESGGKVQVSGGTHAGASGNDNLWAWNMPGHALFWDVDVPQTGRYEVWFVGATVSGFMAEFRTDGGPVLALWFEPTGGWARKNASEWRAFQVRTAPDTPALLALGAGKHRLTLVNRFGMGLNLDRIVLVPR